MAIDQLHMELSARQNCGDSALDLNALLLNSHVSMAATSISIIVISTGTSTAAGSAASAIGAGAIAPWVFGLVLDWGRAGSLPDAEVHP